MTNTTSPDIPRTCQHCHHAIRDYRRFPAPGPARHFTAYTCELTGRHVAPTMAACLLFEPRPIYAPKPRKEPIREI